MKRPMTLALFFITHSFLLWGASFTTEKSQIGFQAIGKPGALKIVGESLNPEALKTAFLVNNNSMTGTATFTLEALTTGISLRDRHMKEKYLETGKFPTCEFKLTKLSLPSGNQENIPFEGTLSLHGVSKPLNGLAKATRTTDKLELDFEFKLKTGEFAISVPSFAGVTMAEEVHVKVKLEGAIK